MNALETSILSSLDGQDPRLLPFLPELLQDLQALGGDADVVERLLTCHADLPDGARILDLGCGKGAVALHLLERHPWSALGVDGMQAFVDEGRRRAEALGVSDRCRFEQADLRTWPGDGCFEAIVMVAVGSVLGDTGATLKHLARWLAPEGVVVIDETFAREGTASRNPAYDRSRDDLDRDLAKAGFRIVAEIPGDPSAQKAGNRAMFESIRCRAEALEGKHPGLETVFQAYVEAQALEFDVIEEDICTVDFLLTRR